MAHQRLYCPNATERIEIGNFRVMLVGGVACRWLVLFSFLGAYSFYRLFPTS